MNWFFKFWHQLLNPHCADCLSEEIDRQERMREDKLCDSCEVLKHELAIAHQDYKFLLEKMMAKEPEPEIKEPPAITKPLVIPWKTKQQILEREDRIKAAAMRGAGKPITTAGKSVEEIEKEIAQ